MNAQPKNKNYRHLFQVSAVKEYCVCGLKKTDKVHIPARRGSMNSAARIPCSRCGSAREHPVHARSIGSFCHDYVPLVPDFNARVLQVGIRPDTPEGRAVVSRTLGWLWSAKVDEGIWTVRAPQDWPPGTSFDATLTDPDLGDIAVELEWP